MREMRFEYQVNDKLDICIRIKPTPVKKHDINKNLSVKIDNSVFNEVEEEHEHGTHSHHGHG